MTYYTAEKILKATDDMTGIEIALLTVIHSLQAEITTLQGRIEALEELVPERAPEE